MKPVRVVHFCTVHNWNDVRVFQKQCVSLAKAGYDVHLVVPGAPHTTSQGVHLHTIKFSSNRIARMTRTAWHAFRIACQLRADIYEIHSPELLPEALILSLLGKPVVYDVHEDFTTLIRQKDYLPAFARVLFAHGVRFLEKVSSRFMTITLAEKYYADFLPGHPLLLNYPFDFGFTTLPRRDGPNCRVLLYAGNVGVERGALLHPSLLSLDREIEVHLVGHCPSALAARARDAAALAVDRLHIDAVDQFLPHARIQEYYQRDDLLAGLAVFPSTPDVVNKELTKFFEYMAAGLPILCSDFPAWRRLVVDNGVGLAVNPQSPPAIAEAIAWLREHPHERQQMGERGRRLVAEQFNWASQEKILLGIYAELAARLKRH